MVRRGGRVTRRRLFPYLKQWSLYREKSRVRRELELRAQMHARTAAGCHAANAMISSVCDQHIARGVDKNTRGIKKPCLDAGAVSKGGKTRRGGTTSGKCRHD